MSIQWVIKTNIPCLGSPIKIQVGVRDSWENTDAPVQKAIRALKDVVGIRVTANPEWPLLHTELGAFYPDKALLVPSVAAAVEACCTVLSALADDDANAEWADELLERTESHMRILVEVRYSPWIVISLPTFETYAAWAIGLE